MQPTSWSCEEAPLDCPASSLFLKKHPHMFRTYVIHGTRREHHFSFFFLLYFFHNSLDKLFWHFAPFIMFLFEFWLKLTILWTGWYGQMQSGLHSHLGSSFLYRYYLGVTIPKLMNVDPLYRVYPQQATTTILCTISLRPVMITFFSFSKSVQNIFGSRNQSFEALEFQNASTCFVGFCQEALLAENEN